MSGELAQLAILDVLHHYCHAYDEGDIDTMAGLFLEDATFRFEPPPTGLPGLMGGRESIRGSMSARRRATAGSQRRHLITNVRFDELSDDRAEVRSYLTLASTSGGSLAILATGVYRDRLRRIGDGWRFESRYLKLDGQL